MQPVDLIRLGGWDPPINVASLPDALCPLQRTPIASEPATQAARQIAAIPETVRLRLEDRFGSCQLLQSGMKRLMTNPPERPIAADNRNFNRTTANRQ